MSKTILEVLAELERDAMRYRWLRDGNAYMPEEQHIKGGEDLDTLCDEEIAADLEAPAFPMLIKLVKDGSLQIVNAVPNGVAFTVLARGLRIEKTGPGIKDAV